MRRILAQRPGLRSAVTCLMLLHVACGGCMGGGVRKLQDFETRYYAALERELNRSKGDLKALRESTRAPTDNALRAIASLEGKVTDAKIVYAVREVLKAPDNDHAAFVQDTRNKVILYHLVETSRNRNAALEVDLAEWNRRRARLGEIEQQLLANVKAVTATGKVLHDYLNQGAAADVRDVFTETGRQLDAFNEEIKKADQENPVIKSLVASAAAIAERVDQAQKGLNNIVDQWQKANEKKD